MGRVIADKQDRDRPISRPNIIFIMADDLGCGDPGWYGHRFPLFDEEVTLAELVGASQPGNADGIRVLPTRISLAAQHPSLIARFETYFSNSLQR